MHTLFDGFIFDIDGTLTSTNQLIFDSFNHITQKYLDRPFSDEEIIGLFGPTEGQIFEKLFGEKHLEVGKDYYQFYSDNHSMANIYPGLKEILIELKKKNYPLGIYTGKGRESSMITITKLGIDKYFDLIVSGDDVENQKPAPDGILKFVDQFKLNNERVLMIGDAVGDVKAARSAGVKIASVLWDSYAAEKVKTMGSDYYFHSVEELGKFLL
jgi:HAD superfamily hydrolase (TIGR01509 family)